MPRQVGKKLTLRLLSFSSVFKRTHWFLTSALCILSGSIIEFFLHGALFAASVVSIGIMIRGLIVTIHERKAENREMLFELDAARWQMRCSEYREMEMKMNRSIRYRTDRMDRLKATIEACRSDLREGEKKAYQPEGFWRGVGGFLIFVAIVASLEIAFVFFALGPLLRELKSFEVYLLSDVGNLSGFIALVLSIVTGSIMLVVTYFKMPISVLREIDEKRMEYGVLGAVLLTMANVIYLIQGMQGVCDHYPRLMSWAVVGMSLATFCTVTSWVMCGLILTRGVKSRNISHALFATTFAVYSSITILYAILELIGRLLGLGVH